MEKDNRDNDFKLLFGIVAISLGVMFVIFLACEQSNQRQLTCMHLDETIDNENNRIKSIENLMNHPISADKPVINLYNYVDNNSVYSGIANNTKLDTEKKQIIANVQLRLQNGNLTCTYPKYDRLKGWNVEVRDILDREAGGTVLNTEDNKEYNYLYWEGTSEIDYNPEIGFVIAGEDTGDFLEAVLKTIGLNRREANEFIVYWLPKMETNKYNYITFLTTEYTDKAELLIEPKPDNLLRVYMMFKGLESNEDMEPLVQNLDELRGDFKREGFTVVEWGGTEILSDRIQ